MTTELPHYRVLLITCHFGISVHITAEILKASDDFDGDRFAFFRVSASAFENNFTPGFLLLQISCVILLFGTRERAVIAGLSPICVVHSSFFFIPEVLN